MAGCTRRALLGAMGAGASALAGFLLSVCCAAAFAQAAGSDVPADLYRRMAFDERFQDGAARTHLKGFKAYGGTWRLQGGELWVAPDAGPKLVSDEPSFTVGEAGVEVLLPDARGGNAGLIMKVSEPGEGADRFNGYEVALDASSQTLRVGRHRQNFEPIKDVPCPVPVNEWIPLVVRMTEKSLEILVSGKSVFAYDDKDRPLASGAVGLRPWAREARFRNLWVKRGGQVKKLPFEAGLAADADPGVCKGWRAIRRGTAQAESARHTEGAFGAPQSQGIAFLNGQGEAGLAYRGTGGEGIPFFAGKPYEGLLWARCDEATDVTIAAESASGALLAEARLSLAPRDWQSLSFTLTPGKDDATGSFAVKLKAPGRVLLGRASLRPGDWAWPDTLSLKGLPPIAVITRHPLSAPPAVGQDVWAAQPRGPGCSIRVFDPTRPEQAARTIFDDPDGCIYDMNVSCDARTLLFSYRKMAEKHWHIWRIGTDGTGLRQLTDGPHYDVSPCPLPDGDILFVSTRRFGYTLCQPGPATNLHRMAPDGSRIRCVSMNTLSDFSPQMLPDGRVLFTRWEYIDRDLTYRQSLWTQNPDGTGYQLYFGNTVRDVGTFWQARPLPGRTDAVVATFAPHHGFPHGAIGLIHRAWGPEGPRGKGYAEITREFAQIGDRAQEWSFRDPFPLSDSTFLCAYGGGANRFRIFLLDVDDNRRLVYEDATMGCYCPLPLRPQAVPPAIAPRTAAHSPSATAAPAGEPTGTFLLLDVYHGLEPAIRRGQVKHLRVMEQIRKTEDLASRAYDQSPVMSYGTYYAKRCWGTVPVLEDGSAHFRAPALREIYFQALDAEGRELQRMTSGAQVMPGERISCIGCHEARAAAPRSACLPLAARRPPMDLVKPSWGNDGVVGFPTLVQPVLDKHCVKCHSGGGPAGGCDLTGDKTRYFNMAYDNLLGRSQSYRQHDMASGEMLASEAAKGKPLVHFYWLLRTPTAINQPLWTGCHASRLTEIIEGDHAKHPIPPEDRQRIYTWMDANVPYYGTYAHARPKSPGKRDLWTDADTGQLSAWFARDFLGVYNRRCASCHGKLEGTTDWAGRFAWINLTRPGLSPALTAHLSQEAGGRGIAKPMNGQPSPVFATTAAPDYQAMLQAIEAGCKLALAAPEADMPGFKGARKEP